MSGYSFDSNILIDALTGDRIAHAEIARVDRPWISRITWIEVLSKEPGGTLKIIENFWAAFRSMKSIRASRHMRLLCAGSVRA